MDNIIQFIETHQDWAIPIVFITAFAESFALIGLFVPGTAILIAAGALAANGSIDPFAALLAGIAGGISGDGVSYSVGKRFGPAIPKMWPFRTRAEALQRGIDFFEKYGTMSVFIGRFFGPLRAMVPLAAGLMHMRSMPFYVANVASAIVWAPALMIGGALLNELFETEISTPALFIILASGVTVLVGIAYLARYFFQPKKHN